MSNEEIESDHSEEESPADETPTELPVDETEKPEAEDMDPEKSDDPNEGTVDDRSTFGESEGNGNSAEKTRPNDRDRQFAKMQRRLNEREMGLDSRSEELDERKVTLDDREEVLDSRTVELDSREQKLDEREAALRQRADELDEREAELDEYEADLNAKAERLTEHEATLHTYLDGQVEEMEGSIRESVYSALERYEAERSPGRFGPTGTILFGLVGLTVAIAGIGYGILLSAGVVTALFGSAVANLAVVAVLLIIGLSINVGAISNRV